MRKLLSLFGVIDLTTSVGTAVVSCEDTKTKDYYPYEFINNQPKDVEDFVKNYNEVISVFESNRLEEIEDEKNDFLKIVII